MRPEDGHVVGSSQCVDHTRTGAVDDGTGEGVAEAVSRNGCVGACGIGVADSRSGPGAGQEEAVAVGAVGEVGGESTRGCGTGVHRVVDELDVTILEEDYLVGVETIRLGIGAQTVVLDGERPHRAGAVVLPIGARLAVAADVGILLHQGVHSTVGRTGINAGRTRGGRCAQVQETVCRTGDGGTRRQVRFSVRQGKRKSNGGIAVVLGGERQRRTRGHYRRERRRVNGNIILFKCLCLRCPGHCQCRKEQHSL